MYGSQLDRINAQIAELERIKQNIPMQQPIQNIINTQTYPQNDFEARYLKENEKVDEIIVQKKTAFIDLKNGVLSIKEINGDVNSYDLLKKKTAEELRIEELERKLEEYEHRFNTTNNEITKSTEIDNADDEPTTKTNSRKIPK